MTNIKADVRIAELHKLYKNNEQAKLVLDWMATRSNNSSVTVLDNLLPKVDIERNDLINVLRTFEETGLGKFIIGRRGSKTRFAWALGLVSVGRVARGEMQVLEYLPSLETEPEERNSNLRAVGDLIKEAQMKHEEGISIILYPDQLRMILEQAVFQKK
jgi:hypothetical protein